MLSFLQLLQSSRPAVARFPYPGGTSMGVRGERFFDNMVVVIVSIDTFLLFVIFPHLLLLTHQNTCSVYWNLMHTSAYMQHNEHSTTCVIPKSIWAAFLKSILHWDFIARLPYWHIRLYKKKSILRNNQKLQVRLYYNIYYSKLLVRLYIQAEVNVHL